MIYVIIGRREKGKTTLADKMIKNFPMRFVIDARRMIDQHDPSIIYENYIEGATNAMYEAIESNGQFSEVVYQPHEDDLPGVFVNWTHTIKSIAIEFPDLRFAVLIDEASFFDLNEGAFQWLAKCTPRDNVHIFITAHRPTDIPPKIRSIADHWLVFHITEQSDLDRIAEKSPEAAEHVSNLRDRSFVWWDDATAKLLVNTDPSSWFIALKTGA